MKFTNKTEVKIRESKESTTVAMYPSLKDAVQKAAKADGRSFSNYVCQVLAEKVGA